MGLGEQRRTTRPRRSAQLVGLESALATALPRGSGQGHLLGELASRNPAQRPGDVEELVGLDREPGRIAFADMVTVRLASPDDLDAVGKILTASGLSPGLADRGHYVRLVAIDDDGALLGFIDGLFDLPVPERAAAGTPSGPQAWGNWMVVAPVARGRGVGQALIKTFVTEAQLRGRTFFAAMVSWADDPTDRVAFLHRCGLRDLIPETPDDILGAPIADILAALGGNKSSSVLAYEVQTRRPAGNQQYLI